MLIVNKIINAYTKPFAPILHNYIYFFNGKYYFKTSNKMNICKKPKKSLNIKFKLLKLQFILYLHLLIVPIVILKEIPSLLYIHQIVFANRPTLLSL